MLQAVVGVVGLREELDESLHLLRRHQPYHESDHVLALAYNVLIGGRCLEDLEARRSDEGFLNALGARRLPDPTTAGDFLRRFNSSTVLTTMEAINRSPAASMSKTRLTRGFENPRPRRHREAERHGLNDQSAQAEEVLSATRNRRGPPEKAPEGQVLR